MVLFNHITTRIPDEPNDKLLSRKGGSGFPYLVFLDETGAVILRHKGSRDAAGFQQSLDEAKAALALRDRARGGDKAAQFDWLARLLELQPLPMEEVNARLRDIGELSAEQKAKLDPMLVNNEFKDIVGSVTEDPATQGEAGRRFAEMAAAGRVPTGQREAGGFWGLIATHAEQKKDAALFEKAFEALKPMAPRGPKTEGWWAKMEAKLKELKGQ